MQEQDGYEAGDMVVVEEDTAPLVFAGAGAYIPTPATLGEMLLGLEDAQFYKQG